MARIHTGSTSATFITKKSLLYILFFAVIVIFAHLLLVPWPYSLIPFGVIGGSVFLFLTFRYPIIGLHFYLLFFLIRPQELFPNLAVMHYPYEKFIGIVVIISLVFSYLVRGKNFELFDVDKGVLSFVLAVALSVPVAVWVGGAKDEFIIFFKIILAYLFIARVTDTQGKFKSVIWFYVLSVGFIAISSMINYYLGNYEYTMGIQRAAGLGGEQGLYSDPNSTASTLVLGMPFIFHTMKAYRRLSVRIFLGLLFLSSLWTVVITGSRGGMLGAILMLLMIGWKSRHRMLSIVAVFFTILVFAAVMPEQYVERFASIARYNELDDETGASESAQGRIKGLKVGLEILYHRPLTGVGIGCFTVYNHDHHGSWLQPHNLVGQLAGEVGFIGILAFIYFIYKLTSNITFIRRMLKRHGLEDHFNYHIATAAKISLILLFFLGMFAHNLYRFNWYLIASFVAIMTRLTEQQLNIRMKQRRELTDDSAAADI